MAVKKRQVETDAVYYITFTCFQWKHLIRITNAYDSIYKWFSYLRTKNIEVLGFVIMPNHVHFMIYIPSDGPELSKLMYNGKRFLGYEIVKRLKIQMEEKLLQEMARAVNPSDKRNNKCHEIFRPSYDAKRCYSSYFTKQKLGYIHRNPVRKGWSLVEHYVDYPHSSAAFYVRSEKHLYCELTHVSLRVSLRDDSEGTVVSLRDASEGAEVSLREDSEGAEGVNLEK